jgi:hypothetical protein
MKYTLNKINNEAEFCTCCGKQGLSKVAWLTDQNAETNHYGVVCAGKLLSASDKKNVKGLTLQIAKYDAAVQQLNAISDVATWVVKVLDICVMYDSKIVSNDFINLRNRLDKLVICGGKGHTTKAWMDAFLLLGFQTKNEVNGIFNN